MYDTAIPTIQCALDRTKLGKGALAMVVLVTMVALAVVIGVPIMYIRRWGPFNEHNPHAPIREWEARETMDA